MSDYDIDKVLPRPWEIREQWYSRRTLPDVLMYLIYDADGYYICKESSKDTAHHIVHCANTHDRNARLAALVEPLVEALGKTNRRLINASPNPVFEMFEFANDNQKLLATARAALEEEAQGDGDLRVQCGVCDKWFDLVELVHGCCKRCDQLDAGGGG